jgi:hypothetical protein
MIRKSYGAAVGTYDGRNKMPSFALEGVPTSEDEDFSGWATPATRASGQWS